MCDDGSAPSGTHGKLGFIPFALPSPYEAKPFSPMDHDACKLEVIYVWLTCWQKTGPGNTLKSFSNVQISHSGILCLIPTFLRANETGGYGGMGLRV